MVRSRTPSSSADRAGRLHPGPNTAAAVALLCAAASAVGVEPAPPASRSASGPLELRFDTTDGLTAERWPVRLGVQLQDDGTIVLAPDPPVVAEAQLVSRVLPATPGGGVQIGLDAEPLDRGPGQTLRLELGDADGDHFRLVAQLQAQAPASPLHVRLDAPPQPWRLRLRVPVGGGRWRVRGLWLRIQEPRPHSTMRVDAAPLRPYQVRIVLPSGAAQDVVVPASVTPQAGMRLLAPPGVGSWSFDRWDFDGVPQPRGRRVLRIDTPTAWEAVARYRPGGLGTVSLRVEVVPQAAPPVQVLLDGVPVPVKAGVCELAAGEQVRLLATARGERAVFDHWEQDGVRLTDTGPQRTVRVGRSMRVRAVYILLGDMNGDGRVDRDDVDVFVLALADPQAYADQYPGLDRVRRGDINGDRVLDWLDIERFVDLVLGTPP